MNTQQRLPTKKVEREELREKGQFWTPSWLAEVMATWVAQNQPTVIFDPAVGPGTFFSAARSIGFGGKFEGFELHSAVLDEGVKYGLAKSDFLQVVVADFLGTTIKKSFPAVISNPPYIRHHRLSKERKVEIKELGKQLLGFELDGRVGLQVYFLLKCLSLLQSNGRLAFLLPADVCEGVSSSALWEHLCKKFRVEGILTFTQDAAPFPNVDTNAMVFLISRNPPQKQIKWMRVLNRDAKSILKTLKDTKKKAESNQSVSVFYRELDEALKIGFSRPPKDSTEKVQLLSNFAKVVRGIATGANELFFLTREELEKLGLEERFFRRAIGRTRDCADSVLTEQHLERLDRNGRPTWLLNLSSESKSTLPLPLQIYLERGESKKLHLRSLIKSRNPWFKMEKREPPPILFAYLGRRDCRFILNQAGVVPLTGFLCVYPKDKTKIGVEKLWRALNHPETIRNLIFVGKSYGKGALKVEPSRLACLEIPRSVLEEFGIS